MDAPFPAGMIEEIEHFLSNNLDTVEDFLIPNVFNTNLFFPLQRKSELREMLRLADRFNSQTIYEIGADKGSGLLHWCKLPSVKQVIACEIRGLPYQKLFEKHFPNIDFLWIEGSSYSAENISKIRQWLGATKIDAMFIDGDKSNFILDFNSYLPMMNLNGVVFMHDIQDVPLPGRDFVSVASSGKYTTMRLINTVESVLYYFESNSPQTSWERWLRNWCTLSCGVGVILLNKSGK